MEAATARRLVELCSQREDLAVFIAAVSWQKGRLAPIIPSATYSMGSYKVHLAFPRATVLRAAKAAQAELAQRIKELTR